MPLGNPIRKQNESRMVSVLATEGQTVFTVQGGYIINHISVFRNGVRLSHAEDFTAGDGSTVTLNNAANIDDRIDFHIFDRFTVQNAIVGAASSQTISGDVVVNGKIFGNLDVPSINTGIVTATQLDLNGSLDVSSTSVFNDDITLPDQKEIKFGASSDLRLYHNGHSIVRNDNSGAALFIASHETLIANTAFDETQAKFVADGAVELYYNNGKKIETSPSGADITGTLNVTGISTFQGVQGTTGTFSGDVDIADKIVHTGDTDTAIRFPGNDIITMERSGTEVFRLDGDGLKIPDKLIHTGDTNTAIRFPAADTFTVETAGSERLRITSAGDVGIGTDIPAKALEVTNNTTPQFQVGMSNNSARASLMHNGSHLYVDTTTGDQIFRTGSTNERLRITSGGKVGINDSDPDLTLHVKDGDLSGRSAANSNCDVLIEGTDNTGIQFYSGTQVQLRFGDAASTAAGAIIYQHSDNQFKLNYDSNGFITFNNGGGERIRIDQDGKLKIGTTATPTQSGALNVFGTDQTTSQVSIRRGSGDAAGPRLHFLKSRNTTDGSHTVVQSGDVLGQIIFAGNDGAGPENGASIEAEVDGTPGSNDLPTRLVFSTTPDGSDTLAEGLRITSDKIVNIAGQGTVFGRLNVPIPTQSGGAAIQVMNTAAGSGDNSLTNIALRSVNSIANNWAHAQYKASSHQFMYQGTTKVNINTNGLCFNSDTTAANALNDYEEGTHTPVATNATFKSTQNILSYTKIGRMVHVQGQLQQGAPQQAGNLDCTLPFTSSNMTEGEGHSIGTLATYNQDHTSSSASDGTYCLLNENDSVLRFMYTVDNAPWQHLQTDENAYVRFQITYNTDS